MEDGLRLLPVPDLPLPTTGNRGVAVVAPGRVLGEGAELCHAGATLRRWLASPIRTPTARPCPGCLLRPCAQRTGRRRLCGPPLELSSACSATLPAPGLHCPGLALGWPYAGHPHRTVPSILLLM